MKNPSSPLDSTFTLVPDAATARHLRAETLPPSGNWMPRPWSDQLMGFIFLPRMLQKGRRVLESGREGRDLMSGYLFGDFDYADGSLLKFLRTNEARVVALLRECEEDTDVAERLIRESGRSAAEIQAWNKRFRRVNALFMAMWDADEGRRAPGWVTAGLKLSYNFVLMPPVYLLFRLAVWHRQRRKALAPGGA